MDIQFEHAIHLRINALTMQNLNPPVGRAVDLAMNVLTVAAHGDCARDRSAIKETCP